MFVPLWPRLLCNSLLYLERLAPSTRLCLYLSDNSRMMYASLEVPNQQHADVRLAVVGQLELLQQIIGVDAIASTIVPEFLSLAEDAQVTLSLSLTRSGECGLRSSNRCLSLAVASVQSISTLG